MEVRTTLRRRRLDVLCELNHIREESQEYSYKTTLTTPTLLAAADVLLRVGCCPGRRILVADTVNGDPLDGTMGKRLIANESEGEFARWVRQVIALEVRLAELTTGLLTSSPRTMRAVADQRIGAVLDLDAVSQPVVIRVGVVGVRAELQWAHRSGSRSRYNRRLRPDSPSCAPRSPPPGPCCSAWRC